VSRLPTIGECPRPDQAWLGEAPAGAPAYPARRSADRPLPSRSSSRWPTGSAFIATSRSKLVGNRAIDQFIARHGVAAVAGYIALYIAVMGLSRSAPS
jgi:hypothetical protein